MPHRRRYRRLDHYNISFALVLQLRYVNGFAVSRYEAAVPEIRTERGRRLGAI